MLEQLRLVTGECTEEKAEALIPVIQSVLAAMRSTNAMPIK